MQNDEERDLTENCRDPEGGRHTSWKFPWQKTTGGKISVITLCRDQTSCWNSIRAWFYTNYRQRTSIGCLTHRQLKVYRIIIFNIFSLLYYLYLGTYLVDFLNHTLGQSGERFA
jgi:hypothetical protein